MKCKALFGLRLLLGLIMFALVGGSSGGLDVVVQHIQTVGPRQWLTLMAGSVVFQRAGGRAGEPAHRPRPPQPIRSVRRRGNRGRQYRLNNMSSGAPNMAASSNAPCGESRTRLRYREPTIPEMLADPIVKAVMAADTVDADMLRAQLSNVARALTKTR